MKKSRIGLNSCLTRNEAIALLIGLGDKRLSPRADPEFEESFSLYEYLYDEFDGLESACKFHEIQEETKEILIERFENHKKLIKTAEEYLCKFDHDISLGESSTIKRDTRKRLVNSIAEHYTIISIQQWAMKYLKLPNISLDDFLQGNFKLPELSATITNPHKNIENEKENVQEDENEFVLDKGLGKTKATNVLATIAFMTDIFAEIAPKYKDGDNPNYQNIAKEITESAKKANGGISLSGQSVVNIRKLLSSANKIKMRVIDKKGDGV